MVQFTRKTVEISRRCPVCRCSLGRETVRCRHCDTPHHIDCWFYVGHCAIYSCFPAAASPASPAANQRQSSEYLVSLRQRSLFAMWLTMVTIVALMLAVLTAGYLGVLPGRGLAATASLPGGGGR